MARIALVVAVLCAACARDLPSLGSGEGDLGAGPADGFSPVDQAVVGGACAPWEEDRAQRDLDEAARLGLLLASARVEGRLGAAVPAKDGYLAPLTIEAVHFGPAFLEGTTTRVPVDAAEAQALPGSFLLGFTGNPLPVHADDGGGTWWSPITLVPAARTAAVADLLGFRPEQAPIIGVVEIAGQDADRTRLRVVETLRGVLPAEVAVNWSRSAYVAPFPAPGPARYVAAFASVSWIAAGSLWIGSLVDWRPDAPAARDRVASALAMPPAPLDVGGLTAAARRYRDGWVWHRAPVVVTTRVAGWADECCTGAGGTYLAHDVVTTLRGVAPSPLLRGGHAWFGPERCGDAMIHGFSKALPAVGGGPFACDGSASTGQFLPTSERLIERPETPEARAEVAAWLAAREPIHRLLPDGDAATPATLEGDAPWSRPLGVSPAFAAGSTISLRVLEAARRDGAWHVTVETTLTPYWYDHLARRRLQIVATCLDPRLARPGATWLAPLVNASPGLPGNDDAVRAAGLFVVPGPLLPDTESVRRTLAEYAVRLGRI